MIKCAVLGAKGYTGVELIKILNRHPEADIVFLGSRDEGQVSAANIVPELPRTTDLVVEQIDEEKILNVSDVIFLALPHTKAMYYVERFSGKGKVIIDLSADYRLNDISVYEKWYKVEHTSPEFTKESVYGLPEINRVQVKTTDLVANPGCYPTSIILALYPLLKRGLIELKGIVADSKSGMTGAGKKASEKNHFCNVYENFQAYKVNKHQHMPEMAEVLSGVAGESVDLSFVPHLLPIQRGILSTVYVQKKADISADKIYTAFCEEYADSPFVRLKEKGEFPQTSDVRLTNFCDIGIQADEDSDRVVIVSVIDNLMKGASSQAVQNMNVRFGLSETAGLL